MWSPAGARSCPPSEIPHIVNRQGLLPSSPVAAGFRYAFSATARRELRREIEAQFARFAETGLALSHVDGHMHLHVHPSVFAIVAPLAERYGATGMRLPRDDLRASLRWGSGLTPGKVVDALFLGLLSSRAARVLGRRAARALPAPGAFAIPSRVYGLHESGRMTEAYVLAILEHGGWEAAELYFHPSTGARLEPLGPNPGDLATLVSPAVKAALASSGARRGTYADLALAKVRGADRRAATERK